MWSIIGIIIGAIVLSLIQWMRNKNISGTWYEWLIGFAGLVLLLFTVQNFFGSLAEVESKAAYMFLLVTGLPAVVLLALSWQLAARRVKKA
jgi:uncharacterized membrane protein YeaQ/YmgE (transglycosylase-associated protein family)